jgi:circadian clock protein KaiC
MHSNELRLYHIDDDGIQIGDMLADQEGLLGGRPSRRPEVANDNHGDRDD